MIGAARIVAWLLLIVIVILTLVPPGLRPVPGLPHNVEHVAIFLLMGAAFGLAYRDHAWSLGVAGILFAAGLELSQIVIPGRHARLSDFLFNALGTCAGIAMAALFERWQRTKSAPDGVNHPPRPRG